MVYYNILWFSSDIQFSSIVLEVILLFIWSLEAMINTITFLIEARFIELLSILEIKVQIVFQNFQNITRYLVF